MAQDVYELGSVFKIFTFALALEDRTLAAWTKSSPIGQGYKIGKHTIHEAEHMPATLAARDILAQSSNIGTAQIALRSGGDAPARVPAQHGPADAAVRPNCRKQRHPLYPAPTGAPSKPPPSASARASRSARSASSPPPATVVNGGRRITPTFVKQDRRRPARRTGDQAARPADRCATCCAMS